MALKGLPFIGRTDYRTHMKQIITAALALISVRTVAHAQPRGDADACPTRPVRLIGAAIMVVCLIHYVSPSVAQTGTQANPPSSTAAASIPTLASIRASQSFDTMDGHVQLLGGNHPLNTTPINGDHYTGTIRGTSMRFGKVNDPLDHQRQALYTAIKNTDPLTYFHTRVEIVPSSARLAKSGTTYWIAAEIYVPSARYRAGAGTILQVHNSTPASNVFGPFSLVFTPAGYAMPKAGIAVITASSSQSIPVLPGFNQKTLYHWYSDNPGFQRSTMGPYPVDTWVKWVFKYRGDPIGGTGFLQAWMNGVPVVNVSNINIGTAPQGFATDYLKIGVDDYQRTAGGADGIWQLLRSVHIVEDNNYRLEQVQALLN